MPYVTQGTIQVEANSDGMFITITPVSDYHAKYANTEYSVFFFEPEPSGPAITDPTDAFLCNILHRFRVAKNANLESIIGHIALSSARVIITVDCKSDHVTGIKFPAKA